MAYHSKRMNENKEGGAWTPGDFPAFPLPPDSLSEEAHPGITTTELYAAMAMHGILTGLMTGNSITALTATYRGMIAEKAFAMADAMLAQARK